MRIAITADLHWGQNRLGDEATRALVQFIEGRPPDLLLLGGDQGTEDHFSECLELFNPLTCPKGLIPGNHDIWVSETDARGDSLQLYEKHLPQLCADHGFHYLDHGPLLFPKEGLAIVGSINWYDYSWSLERLQEETPDWEVRLRNMAFTNGRHNDHRFVRWALDDVSFTKQVVDALEGHLEQALKSVDKAIVLTHHPAWSGLCFPKMHAKPTLDSLLWEAFAGNARLEEFLRGHAKHLAAIFSGHTHRERANSLESVPSFNIGGDYHFKRLLLFDWPGGVLEAHTYGDPSARR